MGVPQLVSVKLRAVRSTGGSSPFVGEAAAMGNCKGRQAPRLSVDEHVQ